MYRSIFGSDNAWSDELLYECAVESQIRAKPVLKGRWGTGKTAMLLLANRELTDLIRKKDGGDPRIWYLSEQALDVKMITSLKEHVGSSRQALIRALQDVWKAEIVRIACAILNRLHEHYGSPRGSHWQFVNKICRVEQSAHTIWKHIPQLFTVILGNTDREKALT